MKLEELRAESNGELLETQLDRELNDWARWDRLNRNFQGRYGDPDAAVVEARSARTSRSSKSKATLRT